MESIINKMAAQDHALQRNLSDEGCYDVGEKLEEMLSHNRETIPNQTFYSTLLFLSSTLYGRRTKGLYLNVISGINI